MTDKQEPIQDIGQPQVIEGETCPFCNAKTLSLTESERDIPYFGRVYLFSMNCTTCHYHKADVESDENNGPVKYTLEVSSEDDLKIRVIKASTATVKVPHVGSIEPGEAASGYVTNVEGILNRLKKQVEFLKEEAEDKAEQKKAKNILKKLTKVLWGQEKIKIILDDPNGNSAIISDKAEIKKGK